MKPVSLALALILLFVAMGNAIALQGNSNSGHALSSDLASAIKNNSSAIDYTSHWKALFGANISLANTALGCAIAGRDSSNVITTPTPTITPGGPTTFCEGGSVTLTSSSATDNQWYLNGNPIGGATSQQYVATVSGDYTVVVTDSGCPSAASSPTTVTVNPATPIPTITAEGPTTFCAGSSVTLTSSSATDNQWHLNSNPIGGATAQQYTATASGDYMVVVSSNSCPNASSTATAITVNLIPPTPTITPGGPTTFFSGGSVTLTSSSASNNQWYLNGNPIGGATAQEYTATNSGDYTVAVSSNSCPSVVSPATTITVNMPPDLSITKTDGVTTAAPGGTVTYTLIALNLGPSDAAGSSIADTFPASLTCTWTCIGANSGTCTASGSGNINDSVNLPNGATVTYTASCSISTSATGALSNTATVTAPSGAIDPSLANNSATDTDTLAVQADVSVTLTDNHTYVQVGDALDYVISVTNAGPSTAVTTVNDALPALLSDGLWICTSSGGASCSDGGSGNTLSDTATVPAGGTAAYTYSAIVESVDVTDQISNTASVSLTDGTDPSPGNNSATDTDVVVIFRNGFDSTP